MTPITSNTQELRHREVMRMDISDVAEELVDQLGPTLVAVVANVRDRKLPYRWIKGEVSPRSGSEDKLRLALRVWKTVADVEGNDVARAWFIGSNPRLGEVQPFAAIRDDRAVEVVLAAKAFVEGTDD